jgi:tetratricopeptide (TPR) repeat protein
VDDGDRRVNLSHPYAINLQSSVDKFSASKLPRLDVFEDYRLYTTRFKHKGRIWNRLRLGFFPDRKAAEKVIALVKGAFPKAWITRVSRTERIRSAERMLQPVPPVAVTQIEKKEAKPVAVPELSEKAEKVEKAEVAGKAVEPVWPVLSEERLTALMEEADVAMTAGEYSRAIQLYTKVLRYPGHEHRRRAQELLALARERKGQLAHARAEYEEYLRLYPEGEDAERVRQRLAALLTARATPKEKLRKAEKDKARTDVFGSFSQFFNRDESFTDVSGQRLDLYSLDNNFDLTIRHRGESLDVRSLYSGGYTFNFLDNVEDDSRISALYVDLLHHDLKVSGRVGRQSASKGGILGRFDGAVAGYRIFPKVKAIIVGGFPVESSRDMEVETSRRFVGVNFDLGTFAGAWESNVFFINQEVDGITDRRAVGGEVRYFKNMLSVFSSVDYDLSYKALTSAILVGNYIFEDRSTLNLQVSYRKTPVLSTFNAIINQGVASVSDLLATRSEDQIRALAEDRTADSWNASLSASHWMTERLQISGDFSASETRSTPASGGVEREPGSGVDYFSLVQLIGSSLIKEGDIATIGFGYSRSSTDRLSVNLNTRYPFSRNWRINPRARLDYTLQDKAGKEELKFQGSVRTDYRWKRRLTLELEAGFEWSDLTDPNASSEARGYSLRAGYRLDF